MKSVELVTRKLAGEKIDIIAKGEFFIESSLATDLAGTSDKWEAKKISAEILGFDYVAAGMDKSESRDCWGRYDLGQRGYFEPVYGGIKELASNLKIDVAKFSGLSRWKKETDHFIFALIDGPFQTLSSLLEYNQFLMDIMLKPDLIKKGTELVAKGIIEIIRLALEEGADGIILGEDIAYARGLIVSPQNLRNVFFPMVKEIVASTDKPIVFHSDGDLSEVLVDITNTGINGIHSLEENAGMELKKVRNTIGDKVCLLGGFDLSNFYEYKDEELIERAQEMGRLGNSCNPYIFGTSAGILDDNLTADKVKLVYQSIKGK